MAEKQKLEAMQNDIQKDKRAAEQLRVQLQKEKEID
jgi:hypothetical protein